MTTTTTTTTQIQTQNKTEESPDNIRTAFHFLKWQDLYNIERPFQIYIEIPPDAPDQRRHNLVFEEGEETIVHNVRDRLDEFSLDRNDFVYLKHATQATKERFADREFLRTVYLPECEQLIRERVDGVDQYEGKLIDFNNPVQPLGPATHVHVDQSEEAAVHPVRLHLPDQADELLKGRLRIINIWRPIDGPVKQWPLAVCDGSTVQTEKMIATDHVRRQYAGCTLYALSDPGMKWYYMKDQMDNEVLLFKNFDSRPNVAKYAPHGSFPLPDPPGQVLPPRASIEGENWAHQWKECDLDFCFIVQIEDVFTFMPILD